MPCHGNDVSSTIRGTSFFVLQPYDEICYSFCTILVDSVIGLQRTRSTDSRVREGSYVVTNDSLQRSTYFLRMADLLR